MAYVMNNHEFVAKIKNVADNYKTVYARGLFGSLVTDAIIKQKVDQEKNKSKKWYTPAKQAELRKLIGKNYFAFDCVNLIKGVLWGWAGSKTADFGGAKYVSNGVPDTNANGMIEMCKNVSTNFSGIEFGEVVWMDEHIGVYIGNGKVIECTPKWTNNVQYTACLNVGKISGMNGRKWTKRGKLPWIDYTKEGGSNMSYLDSNETLYKGVKNDYVKQLQLDLMKLGYSLSPYGADGSFGTLTDTVVRKFQADNRLEVDGRFGGASKKKMKELLDAKKVQPTPPQDTTKIKELENKIVELSKQITDLTKELTEYKNYFKLHKELEKGV